MNVVNRKVRICAFILVILVSSCSEPSTTQSTATSGTPVETLSPSTPKPLQLDVVATPLVHGARISGTTNLPDGTELMLDLRRGPVVGGDKAIVSASKFSADLFPKNGAAIPPGQYEFSVSTPLGDLQPASVKAQLGSDYQALTGPLLKESEFASRLIQYDSKVQIGGKPDSNADREARQAAYQNHKEFSERSCAGNPDLVERLTHSRMSDAARQASVKRCLREMADSRKELVGEGLIEK